MSCTATAFMQHIGETLICCISYSLWALVGFIFLCLFSLEQIKSLFAIMLNISINSTLTHYIQCKVLKYKNNETMTIIFVLIPGVVAEV